MSVLEVNRICELLKYDSEETLFALDLDNTLIFPKNVNLGSVEWYYWLHEKIGFEKCSSQWMSCISNPDYVTSTTIEKKIDNIRSTTLFFLENLKKSKFIISTFRSDILKSTTKRHFQESSLNRFFKKSSTENNNNQAALQVGKRAIFHPDIKTLFCDGDEKGKVLENLVVKMFPGIKRLIIVDDNLKYIEKLKSYFFCVNKEEEEEKERNFQVMVFKYLYAYKLRKFDPNVAEELYSRVQKELELGGNKVKNELELRRKEISKNEVYTLL